MLETTYPLVRTAFPRAFPEHILFNNGSEMRLMENHAKRILIKEHLKGPNIKVYQIKGPVREHSGGLPTCKNRFSSNPCSAAWKKILASQIR